MRTRCSGVALLTALLVVFVATVAATQLVYQLQIAINRSAAVLGQRQAWYYALGAESWAAEILRRDSEDNEADSLSEDWAKPVPALPIEGGTIAGSIGDLQGRFNLNGLIGEDGKPVELKVQQFQRLLRAVELDEGLALAIVDWLDPDSDPGFPGGAEAPEYLARQPGYRSPDGPMASVSELRLVEGIDDKAFKAISEVVSVLPGETTINVNTAPVPVLMSLHPDLGQDLAEVLKEDAQSDGFAEVADFVQHEAVRGLQIPTDGLSVASRYFLVLSEVRTVYGTVKLYSLLERGEQGATRTVSRSLGLRFERNYFPPSRWR